MGPKPSFGPVATVGFDIFFFVLMRLLILTNSPRGLAHSRCAKSHRIWCSCLRSLFLRWTRSRCVDITGRIICLRLSTSSVWFPLAGGIGSSGTRSSEHRYHSQGNWFRRALQRPAAVEFESSRFLTGLDLRRNTEYRYTAAGNGFTVFSTMSKNLVDMKSLSPKRNLVLTFEQVYREKF